MLEAHLLDPKDPLLNYRKKGWDRFQRIGLPKPKQEAFQYLTRKFADFPKWAERKLQTYAPVDGLLFVDGFFEEESSKVPQPIICLSLEEAMRTFGLFLQNRWGLSIGQEKDPFAALNGAAFGKGAFLYLPPKCKAKLSLRQLYSQDEMASPRLHIYLGKEAELTLEQTREGVSGFSNVVLDWVLEAGAQATFIDRAGGDFQAVRAILKRDSKLKAIFLGSPLRNSLRVELVEENAQAELLGLARLEGTEEAHIHAEVEHIAPHARSRQHFKSVLKESSRFSFEGKILVRPAAQKTESYQLNNNLILGSEAVANAKPNLEIFADDVKASHGSTTGSLDEEALFYLRSRGLGLEEARECLLEGFCREITDHAP